MPLTSTELTNLAASLTTEEKVLLLTGEDAWSSYALPSIGLRKMVVSDGPTGVRGAVWDERDPSLSLPSATCLASTWDPAALHTIGQLSAMEGRRKGIDVVLGPTINLHRSPRGGRHFEAYSEDPFLTGALAVAYINGVQEQGVGACPKHYVANDSENDRFTMNSVVGEQTLHELYLAPFETAVTESNAWSIMSAYNRTNGVTMTENALLETPLKSDWGFDGVVVSDWTAVRSVEESGNAAQDWAMPGPVGPWSEGLLAAVQAGRVSMESIDGKVLRMLRLANRVGALRSDPKPVVTLPDARARIRVIAAEGMVLVRNTGVLPLAPSTTKSIAVIGAHAHEGRIMGGGSATVLPFHPVHPLDGLRANAPAGVTVHSAPGFFISEDLEPFPVENLIAPSGSKGVELAFLDESGTELLVETRAASKFINMDPAIATPTNATRTRTRFMASEAGVHRFGTAGMGRVSIAVNGVKLVDQQMEFAGDPAAAFMNPPQAYVERDMQIGDPVDLEFTAEAGGFPGLAFVATSIGYRAPRMSAQEEFDRAVALAKTSDVAIIVVGTTEVVESEGYDRSDLLLPGNQNELVAAIAAANPNTVVIVNSGAPVEMPWRNDVAAILLTWFPGEEMGNAIADVVYGAVEPGGHLPTSWAKSLAEAPVSNTDPEAGTLNVVYSEGLNIGYRAYAAAGSEPAYWMGHGLGYTTWERLIVDAPTSVACCENATISVTLRNTGERAGSNVVQVYLRRRESSVARPTHWLAGFARVSAEAGTSVTAEISIDARRFQHWGAEGWTQEPGTFELIVATDASLKDATVRTIEVSA